MADIVIIGTGGLGRETLWAFAEDERSRVVGFLTNDPQEHGTKVCGLPVLGGEDWLVGRADTQVVCAIGDPRARRALVTQLRAAGVQFASAIHPSVLRSEFVELGEGCVVGARAVLTSQVRVGQHVIIGVGAVVSHDAVLEDFATLAPGVVLTGATHVETCAELGAAAATIPGVRIGRGSLVGAQAAVTEDVPENTVIAGVPARVIRRFPDAECV